MEKCLFSEKKVEQSVYSCPGLNPCLILLKHRLHFEEAQKNNCDVHCALLLDQVSLDVPGYVSLGSTHQPSLVVTDIKLLCASSSQELTWVLFCVNICFVFPMFFPRLSSHIYMLLIS